MPAPLTIAYSPCPNDTFVDHAWARGLLPDAEPPRVTIAPKRRRCAGPAVR